LKPIFAFEIARRVFHAILMEEGQETARVQRTFDAYSEMYGFKQGPRTMFNRAKEEPETPQGEAGQVIDLRQKRLESLREELAERLDHHELEDEGLIFRLKQLINDLEYEIETDEWPDTIGEGDTP
jgi:hypothetical protein